MTPFRSAALALTAAVLATYQALPGGGMPVLIWVALAPLAGMVWRATPPRAAGVGYLYGLGCWWLAIQGWANAAQTLLGLSPLASHALTLVLAAVQAVPFGLAGYLAALMARGSAAGRVLGVAAAGTVALSWVPGILHGSLTHALYRDVQALQLLALGGVPLLLFVLLLVNALVAEAAVRRCWRPLLIGAGVIAAVHAGGAARLSWVRPPDGIPLRLAGIQPAIGFGADAAWISPADREKAFAHLGAMTEAAAAMTPPPDLIVWPELPIMIVPQDEAATDRWLADLARRAGRPILVSGLAANGAVSADGARRAVARAWLYDAEGRVAGHHDKARLIPFGEYLPFEDAVPWLRTLLPFAERYDTGDPATPIALGNGANAIVAICYEANFAADMLVQARAGGTVILNAVNDFWFGDSRLRDLHLAATLFRAVELGIPVARVTNSGQTAFIAPSGRIDAAAYPPADRSAIAMATVDAGRADTPYSRTGDVFLWLTTAGLLLALLQRRLSPPIGIRTVEQAESRAVSSTSQGITTYRIRVDTYRRWLE